MSTVTKVAAYFGLIDPPHVQAWTEARDMADLGELTAEYLTGRAVGHPYHGADPKIGPEPETAEIADSLAAYNRVGYVTIGSQPARGRDDETEDDDWIQRAAVEGFVNDQGCNLLHDAAREHDFLFKFERVNPAWTPWSRSVTRNMIPVSGWSPQYIHTHFGAHLRRRDIAFSYSWCNNDMIDVLAHSWQVTVVDPVWGRKDRLWDVLDGVLAVRH